MHYRYSSKYNEESHDKYPATRVLLICRSSNTIVNGSFSSIQSNYVEANLKAGEEYLLIVNMNENIEVNVTSYS